MRKKIKKGDYVFCRENGRWGEVRKVNDLGYVEVAVKKEASCLMWFRPEELSKIIQK